MSRVFLLILVASVLGIVSAGTVTFLGTCTQNATLQSHLYFNLSNIGNDTAYSLQINPVISGVYPPPAFDTHSIAPDQYYQFNLDLTNVTAKGSYVDYMAVSYQQDSSTFTAIFPCFLKFGNSTESDSVVSYHVTNSSGKYDVNASVYNFGSYAFNSTVSLILPQGFTYYTPQSVNITVPPLQTEYVNFIVSNPGNGPSSGVIASNYVNNGINYASMGTLSLAAVVIPSTASATGGTISRADLFVAGATIILILFCLLIFRAQLKKRREKSHPDGGHPEAHREAKPEAHHEAGHETKGSS